ncbi:hypothetical protein M0804_000862 [Polistes exclamans]|nr:hypothetical protein M0804_000862 [Polistes exclamans]
MLVQEAPASAKIRLRVTPTDGSSKQGVSFVSKDDPGCVYFAQGSTERNKTLTEEETYPTRSRSERTLKLFLLSRNVLNQGRSLHGDQQFPDSSEIL